MIFLQLFHAQYDENSLLQSYDAVELLVANIMMFYANRKYCSMFYVNG